MKRVYLILLFSTISATLVAQDISFRHPVEKTVDYGLNLFVGGQFSNLDKLNKILRERVISEATAEFLLIGGGMNFLYGNHFLHFKGNAALNGSREEISTVRTSVWGFGAGINYGYRFYIGPVYAIPYAGISKDDLFIEIQDLPANNTSIHSQITNRNISKLHNHVLAGTLGCRLLIPNDWETMFTGVDVSYHMPFRGHWSNGDFSIRNAPETNVGGLKIGIEILLIKGN